MKLTFEINPEVALALISLIGSMLGLRYGRRLPPLIRRHRELPPGD